MTHPWPFAVRVQAEQKGLPPNAGPASPSCREFGPLLCMESALLSGWWRRAEALEQEKPCPLICLSQECQKTILPLLSSTCLSSLWRCPRVAAPVMAGEMLACQGVPYKKTSLSPLPQGKEPFSIQERYRPSWTPNNILPCESSALSTEK